MGCGAGCLTTQCQPLCWVLGAPTVDWNQPQTVCSWNSQCHGDIELKQRASPRGTLLATRRALKARM